jgi:hypothetical protein
MFIPFAFQHVRSVSYGAQSASANLPILSILVSQNTRAHVARAHQSFSLPKLPSQVKLIQISTLLEDKGRFPNKPSPQSLTLSLSTFTLTFPSQRNFSAPKKFSVFVSCLSCKTLHHKTKTKTNIYKIIKKETYVCR